MILLEDIFSISLLINLGALLYFIGFLVRDELILRILILVGTVFYLTYYFLFPDGPLWNAIITSSILGLANVWVLAKIVFERTTLALSEDEKRLYEYFTNLNPGQFRKIMKQAKWHDATEATRLCIQAEKADRLYFILDGDVDVNKSNKRFVLKSGNFLGEIAFTLGANYSATAYANPGAHYIAWHNDTLKQLMSKNTNLGNAIIALFNKDLAAKLSSSYQ